MALRRTSTPSRTDTLLEQLSAQTGGSYWKTIRSEESAARYLLLRRRHLGAQHKRALEHAHRLSSPARLCPSPSGCCAASGVSYERVSPPRASALLLALSRVRSHFQRTQPPTTSSSPASAASPTTSSASPQRLTISTASSKPQARPRMSPRSPAHRQRPRS